MRLWRMGYEMKQVNIDEIIDELKFLSRGAIGHSANEIADRIKAHGIAPPDGYVLVPVEPTWEMLDAVCKECNDYEHKETIIKDYKAMLSAVKEKD